MPDLAKLLDDYVTFVFDEDPIVARGAGAARPGHQYHPTPGDAADLLVVDSDPVNDLGTLRRPAHVIVFGRRIPALAQSAAGA